MNKYNSILKEIGYDTKNSALKDMALFQSLSKLEQYKTECEFYEKKYGKSYTVFKKEIRKKKEIEDFQLENDLEDWQFAANTVKWWSKKIKELKSAETI